MKTISICTLNASRLAKIKRIKNLFLIYQIFKDHGAIRTQNCLG